MRTVLFVCTGNTCRSPMAEGIARHHLARGLLPLQDEVFVASAGVQAREGLPLSPETLASLAEIGIHHHGRSKQLNAPMVRKADLILCMTAAHQAAVRELVADSPQDLQKILPLDPQGDIEDPLGMGRSAYDSLRDRLAKLVPQRLKEVLSNVAQKPGGG